MQAKTKGKCADSVIKYYRQYDCKEKKKLTKIHETEFLIDEQFKLVDKIGQGAYGVVVAGFRKEGEEKKQVAIKKIEKAFDDRLYTKRTLRELKLLRLMNHDNIIGLDTIMLPKSREEFDDIYCVNELMETDLRQIIKTQDLSQEHIQFFLYQILRGLKYIHSSGVIHRDLKPRNLLVNSNCDLKICDFGLARSVNGYGKKNDKLTDYVITRWYRPPELLLSNTDYTASVDVWSTGLIFAELINKKPLISGSSSADQLIKIFEIIGTPTDQEVNAITIQESKSFVKNLGKKAPKDLQKLFPTASPQAIDLLKKMLTYDPAKRITVQQALEHPYLAAFHCPEEEPSGVIVPEQEFEFENYPKLTKQQFKDLVYEEILLYHYPEFKAAYQQKIKNKQSICKHIVDNDNKDMIEPHEFSDED